MNRSEGVTIYVSNGGDDNGDGSERNPFAALARAQQAARLASAGGAAVNVRIQPGVYYLEEPLRFTAEDSGSAEAPVVYEAVHGGEVVLNGGIRLDLQWEAHEGSLRKARVPRGLPIDQLFVNGEKWDMARYPNANPDVRIFNGYAADCVSPERAGRWNDPGGGYLHVMHKHLWGDHHYRITGKDEQGSLLYEGGWQNNRQKGMHDKYRFVEHIFEELDAPREWYWNSKEGMLYVFPDEATDLAGAVIEAVRLPHLVELAGSRQEPVRHVELRGITFRHAARTFMDNREPLLRSDWTIYRGGAVTVQGSEDCAIADCRLEQLGGNAIFANGYNRRLTVQGCHLDQIGASGIAFVGRADAVRSPLFEYEERQSIGQLDMEPGPLSDDYPADCLVEDCLITRCGTVEKQSAPVQLSMAMDITVRHCSIYDAPRAGINISEGTWGGHLIEHCDIFDTVLETGDHGSFNSWGRDRYWGLTDVDLNDLNELNADAAEEERERERSSLPLLDAVKTTIIRNNRWRCDNGWDIDLDDGSSNYHIYNNLCLAGGIKLREGFYRICENNIMVNNSFHPHVWYKGSRDVFRHNIVFADYLPIRVPQPWGLECDGNFLHVPGLGCAQPASQLQQLSGRDEHSVRGDAGFIDPAAGDYRVAPDSAAMRTGFVNFDMDRFGVRKPELKAVARTPKLPSYAAPAASSGSGRDAKLVRWGKAMAKNIVGLGEVSAAGLPEESGVVMEAISWGSWQLEAGLQVGDVLWTINGRRIEHVDQMMELYEGITAGEAWKLTVYRGQREIELQWTKS
ncbi:PDZ domain-containing protein [Paenibacillus sp. H1-7]|uniref:PDZ domain-containing protein n=1 Tax=Paenibacillus sp. H1-7 TaxID=2282849 RepID=UPI001EF7E7EA|nr:PDZ domain-containing protein [Paenibacillus sp. H1-7]ULL18866.1 PDZ domain-containing protein [Paenibacillus sp. H1-7]